MHRVGDTAYAETRFAQACERHDIIAERRVVVDHDGRRVQLLVQSHRLLDVVAEHGSLEGDGQGIGLCHRRIEVVVAVHADDRTENLELADPDVRGRIEKHGRSVAAVGNRLAAGQQLRPCRYCFIDPIGDTRDFRTPNQWAHLGRRLFGRTDLQVGCAGSQRFGKFLCLGFRNVQPLYRHAHLAGVVETTFEDGGQRGFTIVGRREYYRSSASVFERTACARR